MKRVLIFVLALLICASAAMAEGERRGGRNDGSIYDVIDRDTTRDYCPVDQYPYAVQNQCGHDAIDDIAEANDPHLLVHVMHALPDDHAQD